MTHNRGIGEQQITAWDMTRAFLFFKKFSFVFFDHIYIYVFPKINKYIHACLFSILLSFPPPAPL